MSGAKKKLAPAALTLLRAGRRVLEDTLAGQILQRQLAGIIPTEVGMCREYKFLATRDYRADFAFPRLGLLVEVDGGTNIHGRRSHAGSQGIEHDRERDALALLDGWKILRVTAKQVNSQQAVTWIEKFIRMTLDKQEHRNPYS